MTKTLAVMLILAGSTGTVTGTARASVLGTVPVRQAAAARPLVVMVSIAPLKGLVEPLVPAGTSVELLVPAGVSEHGYEVPPSKLAQLAKADLIVLAGLGLEPQIEKFLAADAKPKDGRRILRLADVAGIKQSDEHEHHDHDEHEGHDHSHGGTDPHVWLDPQAALKLVASAAAQVRELCPVSGQSKEDIDHREAVLIAKLQKLDATYKASIATAKRRKIVVAHDAYDHLARRYGFETIAIAGLTAAEPSPSAIAAAVKAIKAEGLPVVFVEPQLSPAAAKKVADRAGVKTRVLDPLGTGNYFEFMESNLDAILEGLGGTRVDPSAPKTQPVVPPSVTPTTPGGR